MDDEVLDSIESGQGLPKIKPMDDSNPSGLTTEQRSQEPGLISTNFGFEKGEQSEK